MNLNKNSIFDSNSFPSSSTFVASRHGTHRDSFRNQKYPVTVGETNTGHTKSRNTENQENLVSRF